MELGRRRVEGVEFGYNGNSPPILLLRHCGIPQLVYARCEFLRKLNAARATKYCLLSLFAPVTSHAALSGVISDRCFSFLLDPLLLKQVLIELGRLRAEHTKQTRAGGLLD